MNEGFLETIRHRVLLADGAMGTQLMDAGLSRGACGELWNLDRPDKVFAIQRRYVEAGSDCLITNTFGGCRLSLERHGLADKTGEINAAAVAIAREAFGEKEGFVLGDIGPFGGMMEPYGEVPEDDVREALDEQAFALVEAGADAVIVETQCSFEELGLAIEAARKAGASCVIASLAFDVTVDGAGFRTMMGIDPAQAAGFAVERGAHVVGLNCGTGMDMAYARQVVQIYHGACELPVMAQPNAGAPVIENDTTVFNQTPEEMAADLPALLDAGVNVVGGCCGTSPDHIRAFRAVVDAHR